MSAIRSSSGGSPYISPGPSERFDKGGHALRNAANRAWPPNVPSLSVHPARESESHIQDDEARLKARWQLLADGKSDAENIRHEIEKQTSRLERARQVRDGADNHLMSLLRPTQVDTTAILDATALAKHFSHMQQTRYMAQQHEVTLKELGQSLQHKQDELDILERRLINELHPSQDDMRHQLLKIDLPEQSQSLILMDLEIRPADMALPPHQDLAETLKDIRVRREERADLFSRRSRVESQARDIAMTKTRRPDLLRYLKPLGEDDLQFLRHFDAQQRWVAGDLRALRQEVEHLIQVLWEEKLVPSHVNLDEVQSWYPDDFCIDVDLGRDPKDVNFAADDTEFQILLSDPRHLFEDFPVTAEMSLKQAACLPEGNPHRESAIAAAAKEVAIENLVFGFEDKLGFINRWMLQILRTSRGQAEALYTSFLADSAGISTEVEEWQWDVLNSWWKHGDRVRNLEEFGLVGTEGTLKSSSPPSWMSEPVLYDWGSDEEPPNFEVLDLAMSDVSAPSWLGRPIPYHQPGSDAGDMDVGSNIEDTTSDGAPESEPSIYEDKALDDLQLSHPAPETGNTTHPSPGDVDTIMVP